MIFGTMLLGTHATVEEAGLGPALAIKQSKGQKDETEWHMQHCWQSAQEFCHPRAWGCPKQSGMAH